MSRQYPKCPECDSNNVVPIVFGYPSDKLFVSADRGEVSLGGCCVEVGNPEWHCKDCGDQW